VNRANPAVNGKPNANRATWIARVILTAKLLANVNRAVKAAAVETALNAARIANVRANAPQWIVSAPRNAAVLTVNAPRVTATANAPRVKTVATVAMIANAVPAMSNAVLARATAPRVKIAVPVIMIAAPAAALHATMTAPNARTVVVTARNPANAIMTPPPLAIVIIRANAAVADAKAITPPAVVNLAAADAADAVVNRN
jgi:hypothetical protein